MSYIDTTYMQENKLCLHLLRLESMCKEAYSKDFNEITAAVRDLSKDPLATRYPFLFDAILTHLMWMKGCQFQADEVGDPGVYAIEYQKDIVKIGKTANFNQRLRALSTVSPIQPVRVHFERAANHTAVETILHRKFAEQRMTGEFFSIDFDSAVLAIKATVMGGA